MKSKVTYRMTADVGCIAKTEYERHNHHKKWLKYPETFVCITMQSTDGRLYICFTEKHTAFAQAVNVGDKFVVQGNFKREQEYGGEKQIVLTHCILGEFGHKGFVRTNKVYARNAFTPITGE